MRQDVICLLRDGASVRSFPLQGHALEVGSHRACDISLCAEAVPAQALYIHPSGGTVYVYDLARDPGLARGRVMALDRPVDLGGGFAVVRRGVSIDRREPVTVRCAEPGVTRPLALLCGEGSQARSFRIGHRPLSVGASPENAITLPDGAVSRFHCRVEPCADGVEVRDLESTNGTWVDGLRVQRTSLRPGVLLRLGRTVLRVVGGASPRASGPTVASGTMLSTMALVDRFSALPWPVLVLGETGVGKELVARGLHERGGRSGPFVALNAGGLPRELIESELFGHERGAFTGAVQAHRGAFEQAHGGTLFLDEVAELPRALQSRLLRVLETWCVRRVGSEQVRQVDVRLVCATHRDLRRMVREEEFRADLFYRIHRLLIEVPPLRRRPEDIAALAEQMLASIASEVGPRSLAPDALSRLRAHTWPGNVRELRNALELAVVDSDRGTLDSEAIDRALRRLSDASARLSPEALQRALEEHGGNMTAAARALGLPRSTMRDRLRGAAPLACPPSSPP